ncbi:hypothetical protein [Nitrospira moscoviensis]|uniref:DUF5666 domain-containing protein n=1 Tax=Nitrospira moscoviensis TaxID=42253 RepID=A0A0K2GEH2_NITMO|nr:hypothetical protein [Nitrospira moscoviensis]ALA58992.1 exported protein of unknown function [Nitrospira moscoviensis]
MTWRATVAGGAIGAVLAIGSAALAEQQVRPSSEPEVQGAQAREQARSPDTAPGPEQTRSGWKNLRGDVERVKRVALRGGPEGEHLVALVAGGMGRRMVVDLGLAKQYRDVPVMTGDEIVVRGPISWISDRKVLMAQRAFINGEMVKVKRDRTMDPRQLDRGDARGTDTAVTGQIEHAQPLRLRGVDRQHMVARVKTQDGRTILTDLGAPQDLDRIPLEPGRSLTVTGPTIQVNGKPLILARQVSADGATVRIDRDIRSVMPVMAPGPPPAAAQQQAGEQAIQGEVIVRGELYRADRDGFYVVRDEAGQETYLVVTPEVEKKGLRIGDRVTAQVKPDGTVLALERQEASEALKGTDAPRTR